MSNEESMQDKMEVERTFQANERTLLECVRTGLSLLVGGVVIVYFSHGGWFAAVGVVCILIGIITGIVGVGRYRRMNSSICLIRKRLGIEDTSRTAGGARPSQT